MLKFHLLCANVNVGFTLSVTLVNTISHGLISRRRVALMYLKWRTPNCLTFFVVIPLFASFLRAKPHLSCPFSRLSIYPLVL